MTTITELFNLATTGSAQTPIEKLTKAVTRLSEQIETAQADADHTKLLHETALVDHALNVDSIDEKALAKLRAASDAARDRLASLQGALVTVHARLSAAEASATRDEHVARWGAAVAISGLRLDAMRRAASSLAAFAADYRAAVAINGELVGALPANPDPDGAMTRADLFEAALRRELVRQGCAWAAKLVQPACDLPPMLPQFEGAHELVKRWAPEA